MTDHERLRQLREQNALEEAMRAPVEDRVAKWKREADEQEARFAEARAKRARPAEPAPVVDIDLRIATVVADERQYILDLMAEIIAETAARQREAIDAAVLPLQAELSQVKAEAAEQKVRLCELEIVNANLREQLAVSRGTTIDLPALRSRAN